MRGTWQPSVPAPMRRHFTEDSSSKLRDGKARHLISFKLKSDADTANLVGSMDLARSIHLDTNLFAFLSHPTALGAIC